MSYQEFNSFGDYADDESYLGVDYGEYNGDDSFIFSGFTWDEDGNFTDTTALICVDDTEKELSSPQSASRIATTTAKKNWAPNTEKYEMNEYLKKHLPIGFNLKKTEFYKWYQKTYRQKLLKSSLTELIKALLDENHELNDLLCPIRNENDEKLSKRMMFRSAKLMGFFVQGIWSNKKNRMLIKTVINSISK